MKPEPIRLFVKPGCGWCRQAQDWLDDKGIRYELIDVTASREGRRQMRELSGQTLAPVLETGGRVLADFDTGQLAEFWKQIEQDPRERT
jgi:monothiol glutaredoxin